MLDALSKSEAAYVAGLGAAIVDRAIDRGRFGWPFVTRQNRVRQVSAAGIFLIAADHLMSRDVGAAARAKLRRYLERQLRDTPIAELREVAVPDAALPLRVDLSGIAAAVSGRLVRLEAALAHIVEDGEVQAGAPTFRGTRVLVRPVAAALERGVDRAELKADYSLAEEQLDAALVFAAARPARGRPGPATRPATRPTAGPRA